MTKAPELVSEKLPTSPPLTRSKATTWAPNIPSPFFVTRPEMLPVASATPPSDRKSTRLNSSHITIAYAGFGLKKKRYAAFEEQVLRGVSVELVPVGRGREIVAEAREAGAGHCFHLRGPLGGGGGRPGPGLGAP